MTGARVLGVAALATLLVTSLTGAAAASDPGPVTDAAARSVTPCPDWAMYGHRPARTFATACPSGISPSTASFLRPAWFFKTPKTVTASPAVVDGRVFVGDWSGTMFALDANIGALVWSAATQPAPGAAFGPIVSSAAVADVRLRGGAARKLVLFGAGPRLYALDAADGSEVWVHDAGAGVADEPTEIESSPVVWDGVVYVGMDVHNRTLDETGGVRGGLLALDAATGERRWFFDPELGGPASGCSSVWSSPTIDPVHDHVVLATGNCPHDGYPWTPHTEAVTALDLDTGVPVWTFQPDPGNRDDVDFGATGNLFRLRDGTLVYGIGKKDAAYYLLDPATGELIWRTQVAEPGNVDQDFAIGGFIGSTAAWGGDVFGGTAIGGPPYFHALDGATGQVRWTGVAGPTYAASTVVNGVVIAGALDNELKAWNAHTGDLLAAWPLAGPISSGPAIVGNNVYVGSGTSSSDACAKDTPVFSEVCFAAFEEVLGATGGVHAFTLAKPGHDAAVTGAGTGVLFSGEDNRLNAYDLATLEKQTVIRSAADTGGQTTSSQGLDINAQICFFPDGSRRFVAGEDTAQSAAGGQGWGIFELHGEDVGHLSATQVGKLSPTFVTTSGNPENYGCGFLADGRIVTSDVGDQFPGQPATGQLIVWFPPFDAFDVAYCKIDVAIATAGGIHVDELDRVYVAANRPGDDGSPAGIYRFSGAWPTSGDAAGGCGRTDQTGAPLVDEGRVTRELFIEADARVTTPSAIVPSRRGTLYVSSVFTGAIAEYDAEGAFVREIVAAAPGAAFEATGTPFGLAVAADGTLYYADLGIEPGPPPGPGAHKGTVRRVRFDDAGAPLPPEVMDAGLEFPDGLGLFEPGPSVEGPPPAPLPSVAAEPATLPATGGGLAGVGLVALLLMLVSRWRGAWRQPCKPSGDRCQPHGPAVAGGSRPDHVDGWLRSV